MEETIVMQQLAGRIRNPQRPPRVTLYLKSGHKVTGDMQQLHDGWIVLNITRWWELFGDYRYFTCHPSQIVGYSAKGIDQPAL